MTAAPATLKPMIEALTERRDLTRADTEAAMRGIIAGVDPCQTAAFLCLLRAKGETPSEVAGMVSVMREHMVPVDPGGPCVDVVGTGGDGHHTVNFSTAASIVAAACGARVAKHGNRSVSSQCGSADVLETLGVKIGLGADGVERCLAAAGIAFMFAPGFHPAMKNVVPVRKALGVRTVFNILGPMLNPAACGRGLIGVYSEPMVVLMAEALHQLGAEHVIVVHCGGLDELAPIAVATAATVTRSGVAMGTIDPFLLGFEKCSLADLKGGTAAENAAILRDVLSGRLAGPVTDTVVLNAGAALHVAGLAPSIAEGCKLAAEAIKAGKPMETLQKWVETSQA
jgi:anthranilate phosphoribosyltransferase